MKYKQKTHAEILLPNQYISQYLWPLDFAHCIITALFSLHTSFNYPLQTFLAFKVLKNVFWRRSDSALVVQTIYLPQYSRLREAQVIKSVLLQTSVDQVIIQLIGIPENLRCQVWFSGQFFLFPHKMKSCHFPCTKLSPLNVLHPEGLTLSSIKCFLTLNTAKHLRQ